MSISELVTFMCSKYLDSIEAFAGAQHRARNPVARGSGEPKA
jgi:hypothetical protein